MEAMNRYLERTAYQELVRWKSTPNHATLEISGARQVGKTYLVKKFAMEYYKQYIYINLLDMAGEIFLSRYEELIAEIKNGKKCENPVYELIKRHEDDFVDSSDTLVIIDEIQESSEIYNRVREFTRTLKSDFIITGSYLGRILNKNFKYSAGDLDTLEIHTLSFNEFSNALGKGTLFESLDLYGGGEENVYHELSLLYDIYCTIGGYPAVVLQYINHAAIDTCQAELLKIIHLFTNESKRYFDDILDDAVYENMFAAIARLLVREKKGLEADSLSEDLQKIVTKDYSSNLSKASVNRAIDWLYSSGIIGFVGKINQCSILDFKAKARCYFMDVGLTTYFLMKIGCSKSEVNGVINENFVYLNLKQRIVHPAEIALESPAFATLANGEIDFYVKTMKLGKTYAVEVKAGKNNSKTIAAVLEQGKADYILYAKGNTHGGIKDNIITIPVYGISKFKFN